MPNLLHSSTISELIATDAPNFQYRVRITFAFVLLVLVTKSYPDFALAEKKTEDLKRDFLCQTRFSNLLTQMRIISETK